MKKTLANLLLLVALASFAVNHGWIGGVVSGPAPVKEPGFRVMFIEETDDHDELPLDMLDELVATGEGSVRAYATAHAVKPDGKNPEVLLLDRDDDVSKLPAYWADAYNRRPHKDEKDKLPWLIASNGKTGYEGKLPAKSETLKIFQGLGE